MWKKTREDWVGIKGSRMFVGCPSQQASKVNGENKGAGEEHHQGECRLWGWLLH